MREESATTEGGFHDYFKATVSRAQLLAAAGAGLAMVVVPGAALTASAAGTGRAPSMEFPFFP